MTRTVGRCGAIRREVERSPMTHGAASAATVAVTPGRVFRRHGIATIGASTRSALKSQTGIVLHGHSSPDAWRRWLCSRAPAGYGI